MPRVSVFMPAYNHAGHVAAAIKSIQDQSYQDFEIVVTDDGSTDGTPDVIAALAEPRLRLKRFPVNRGAAFATNDAIRRCEGEYLALLSSDDVFLPHKLERQVEFLDANPRIGAVFGYPDIIDHLGDRLEQGAIFNRRAFEVGNRDQAGWLRHFFMVGNCLCHPTMMIRRACYDDVGLYDARYANVPDFDMWIRLVAVWPIHVLPETMIGFRELPNAANASAVRVDSYLRTAWEEVRMRRRYAALPAALFEEVFAPEIARLGLDPRQDRRQLLGRICVATDNPILQRLGLDLLFDALPASPRDTDPTDGFGHPDLHRAVGRIDAANLLPALRVGQLEAEPRQVKQSHAAATIPIEDVPPPPAWQVPALDALKLHLGCGPSIIPGWINLDRVPLPGAHFWDATMGIPSAANTISLIYSEHFIEHLTLEEGLALLRECERVLCPGGIMRISTPDIRVLMRAYLSDALDDWSYVGWRPASGCDLMNEGMRSWGRQYLFDRPRLAALLSQAGFAGVAAVPWGSSSVPELCGRECRPFHGELIFEAQKRLTP